MAKNSTAFKRYLREMMLRFKYNYVTDEYMVVTCGYPVVVAVVPGYVVHNSHRLDEAKQLIKVGLDLHNCFT